MFKRIAHLFGFRRKDEALARRFARIKELYETDPATAEQLDVVSHIRHGMQIRSVVGAEKSTKELLRQSLLESYAQHYEKSEAVASSSQ